MRLLKINLLLLLIVITISSCCCFRRSSKMEYMHQPFEQVEAPTPPDYSLAKSWAALPNQNSICNQSPNGKTDTTLWSQADVFWIHPTSYTQQPKGKFCWNASVDDAFINSKTDNGTMKFQASAFNEAGRIYAPRYRQAHLYAFFTPDKSLKRKALKLAYSDVKTAFEYYLKNYNHGRPIIIAAHSQGGIHAYGLLRDYFASKPLMKQLVCAYIVGMPIPKDSLNFLLPCTDSTQTGCYVSWYTFKEGFFPKNYYEYEVAYCVNPLTWTPDEKEVGKEVNRGAVLRDYNKITPHFIGAKVHKSLLWVKSPFSRLSPLSRINNYHIGDINLFYVNVKENAKLRVQQFLQKH
jgi:hypothetical protein